MADRFKVGDHVRWNSEAGYVQGVITKAHTRDDGPQYEIKSYKTDQVAMHKGAALEKL